MHYILSEAEYEALKKAAEDTKLVATKKLQVFCTRVANELPVDWGWTKGDPPKPWGCILSTEHKGQEWYCDECPAQEVCPYPGKCWSK